MLELLRIQNLALIDDLEIEFAPGMNVLTGETGAGKSFILKALSFLLGEKLGTSMVRPGAEKATVEALFHHDSQELILRRELSGDSGRSRLYINDKLSSQEIIKELRPTLILHTSQHGQQQLLQPQYHALILDGYLSQPDLLAEKESLLRSLQSLLQQKEALSLRVAELSDKRDMYEFQLQEIEKVSPKEGEEEALEQSRLAVRNQAQISDLTTTAIQALHGGDQGPGLYHELGALEKSLAGLTRYLDDFSAEESLLEIKSNLHDLDTRVRQISREIRPDVDIEAIEERLYILAQLKRKLKRPLSAIVALQEEITANLDFLDSCSLEQKELQEAEDNLCNTLAELLNRLNTARRNAAQHLCHALEEALVKLGFSEHIRIIFDFYPVRLHPVREDCTEYKGRILWQPNPGQAVQPLDQIASGGELSRFLLAVTALLSQGTPDTPTLIFDEVDAGIGGMTLHQVADCLDDLAATRQMLLITHWPQLAKRAERHFVINKEVTDGQTYTRCRRLSDSEIIAELDRMTGEGPR